jgi:hypothetical protein
MATGASTASVTATLVPVFAMPDTSKVPRPAEYALTVAISKLRTPNAREDAQYGAKPRVWRPAAR